MLAGVIMMPLTLIHAQDEEPYRFEINLLLANGIPVGSFRSQLEDVSTALGFAIQGQYALKPEGNWYIGADVGSVRYEKIRDLMWVDNGQLPVKTTFHFTTVGALATYQWGENSFKPHVSVIAGLNILYTATRTNKGFFDLLFNDFENELIYDKSRVAPSLAIMPGFTLGRGSVRFTASCKFVFSGKVRHVDPATLDVSDINAIEYNYKTTYPRMIIPQAGISILLF